MAQRVFIEFDAYELELIRKVRKAMQSSLGRSPTMGEAIRACLRWAAHMSIGDDRPPFELPPIIRP